MLDDLNAKIETIEVCDIKENTFYAFINLKYAKNRIIKVDSRPSDAIAIAVRKKCKI